MTLELNRTESPLSREERYKINENWTKIESSYNGVVDVVATQAFEKVVDSAKLDWLAPVDTFADLATTYPNAVEGNASMARDTGIVYRFDGAQWIPIQQIDATAINEVESRLAKAIEQVDESVNKQSLNNITPMASVIFDDGYIWDYTIVFPYFKSNNIVGTSALISDFVEQNANVQNPTRYMNSAMINEMKEYGWEYLSHTASHKDLSTLSYSDQEYEMRHSKEVLASYGLETEAIVYPLNHYNQDTLEIARKYYKYAFAQDLTWKYYYNTTPINQYAIHRITLENDPGNFKILADKAIAENAWIVLMGHSFNYAPGDPQYTQGAWENTIANIEYLISKGIPFVKTTDAIKKFNNPITIGDDLLAKNTFMIGSDGKILSNQLLPTRIIKGGGITAATDISKFEPNTLTIVTQLVSDNGGFPTDAGTLYVYYFRDNPTFIQQIWEPFDSNAQYTRKWIYSLNTWTSWVNTRFPDFFASQSINLNNVTKSGFQWVNYTASSNFPSSITGGFGVLETLLHDSGDFGKQTLKMVSVNKTFERRKDSGIWGLWDEILSGVQSGTWSPQISSYDGTYTSKGSYHRQGNLVHVNGSITITTKNSTNIGITIGGLPFPANSTNYSLIQAKLIKGVAGQSIIGVVKNSTGISILQDTGNAINTYLASDSLIEGSVIYISGTYQI